jgi:hypothetical protein
MVRSLVHAFYSTAALTAAASPTAIRRNPPYQRN